MSVSASQVVGMTIHRHAHKNHDRNNNKDDDAADDDDSTNKQNNTGSKSLTT